MEGRVDYHGCGSPKKAADKVLVKETPIIGAPLETVTKFGED